MVYTHKYFGFSGTNVIAEDDNGGPIDNVDEACRLHDIAYMLGEDPSVADDELLRNVWETGSPYYYAFWLAIKTKQAFEAVTGKEYTSALYVTPVGTAATFAHYFYFKSVFDALETNNSLQLGLLKEKELSWRNEVLDIWRGQCYVQKRPGSDIEGNPGSPMDISPSYEQLFGTDTRPITPTEGTNDDGGVLIETDYPAPPRSMAPCRVVINEILTRVGPSSMSFIELLKVCPEHAKKDEKHSLSNFILAVVEAADPPRLHILIDLSRQKMYPVSEQTQTAGGLQMKNNYYFVVGSTNVKERKMNLRDAIGGRNGIPSGTINDKTFSVVLLQFDRNTIEKIKDKYKFLLPAEMTEDELGSFGIALQDIVTYGDTCNRVKYSTFLKWNLGIIQLNDDNNIEPIHDQTDIKTTIHQ